MLVTFISDTHRYEHDVTIEECDLLIHSGDIDARTLDDVIRFYRWFKSLKAKYKIFVPGNHDFFFEKNMNLCKETFKDANITVLNNESVKVDHLKIWGSPITPTFFNWAFMADRGDEIKQFWDMIPEDTDILITHGPPSGIFDYVSRGGNVGCFDLLKTIEKIKPKIHAFGHIHEGYGQLEQIWNDDKKTTFINASLMDENYDLVNKPITVEI